MPKDHKKAVPGTIDPQTRPVCGASDSINGELSETTSDILDAASDALETVEVTSTEDLLGKLEEVNEILKTKKTPEEGYFVGSLDAKALYPSLDIRKCSRIAAERVIQSGVEIQGVNWEWATVYVALNMPKHSTHRWTSGSAPG